MGYACYDTPLGPGGYAVDDHCHQQGCDTEIDRGLSYLCGSTPGQPDEHGCGKWFCGAHLFVAPVGVAGMGGGLCGACYDALGDSG
jgi:hypothetical protein